MSIRLGTTLINSIAKGDSSQHGPIAGAGTFIGRLFQGQQVVYSYDPSDYIERPTVAIQVAFAAGNLSATLTANAAAGTGPGGPFTYQWYNAAAPTVVIGTNQTLPVTEDGTYEVVATDSGMNESLRQCALVDINVGPSTALTGPASVEHDADVVLTYTVSDPDHVAEVAWSLTQNGSIITSGSGEESNVMFTATASSSGSSDTFVLTATDPFNASATSSHSVTLSTTFSPSASFSGTQPIPASSTTVAIGDVTTNIANPVVVSFSDNRATDGASRLDSSFSDGGFSDSFTSCTGTISPPRDDVRSGTTYSYTGSRTRTRTFGTDVTTYRTVQTTAPASTSTEPRTVTITGTIPTGMGFANEGTATSANFSVMIAGDTAQATPTQNAPCNSNLAVGSTCQVTNTPATQTTPVSCSLSTTGTGSLVVNINQGGQGYTTGTQYTATPVVSTNTFPSTPSYSWTVTGGASASGTGNSISFTPTSATTTVINLTATLTDARGNTVTDTAQASVTTVSANTPGTGSFNNAEFFPAYSGGTWSITGHSAGDEVFPRIDSTSGAWRLIISGSGLTTTGGTDTSGSTPASDVEATVTVLGTGTGTISLQVVGSDGSTYSTVASFSYSVS